MEIVTGSTGQVHVTPIDDAVRNSNIGYLSDKVVFTYLRNFEAISYVNNEIRVFSGYGMNQGRLFKIDDSEWDSVTVENGAQGYKRADLIVARYHMDTQTGFETITLEVIKGTAGSSYVDPTYTTGDINAGDDDDFPLYRVRINGLNIEGLDRLFTPVPDGGRLGEIEEKVNAHKTAFDALNIKTNLASESNVFLKDGANARPGVEGILPANHGGTGKATLKDGATDLIGALDTNALAPSNADYYVGTTSNTQGFQRKPLSALWSWISAKLGTMGYGDMTKGDFCDNPDSEIPTIKQSRGGTGSRDGSINGVKLGKNGTTMGYYDANNQFRSFRQPTGNATAAQVLSGYTFANADSDSLSGNIINRGEGQWAGNVAQYGSYITFQKIPSGYYPPSTNEWAPEIRAPKTEFGTAATSHVLSGQSFTSQNGLKINGAMANYSGSNRRTVTPSGGTGNEQLSLSAGYHDSIIVNRTNPYNAGYNAGQSITWTEWLYANAAGSGQNKYGAILGLPYKNVVKIKNVSSWPIIITYKTSSGMKTQTLAANAEMTPPTGAITDENWHSYWTASYDRTSEAYFSAVYVLVTFQTKVLR